MRRSSFKCRRLEDRNGRSHSTKNDKAIVDHTYMIRSPSVIKRNLKSALDILHCTKKKLKVHQQKSRRLKVQMKSFEKVLSTLKEKELLSETACSNLKSSFSSSALSEIMTRLGLGNVNRTSYSAELRSFALSLQFYSKKAYEFVRQSFNKCLPHSKTLANCQLV